MRADELPSQVANKTSFSPRLQQAVGLVVIFLAAAGFLIGLYQQFTFARTICRGEEPCRFGQLGPEGAQAAAELGLSLDLYAAYNTALTASFALVSLAVGALIVRRRAGDRGAMLVAALLIVLAWIFSGLADQLESLPGLLGAVIRFVTGLDLWYAAFLLYVFPDGRLKPGWTRWMVLGVLVAAAAGAAFPDSPYTPLRWGGPFNEIIGLGSGVVAQTYRYRRLASAPQRAQIKWAVFGTAVAVVGFLGIIVAMFLLFPQGATEASTKTTPTELVADMLVGMAVYGFFLLIPISIGVAIIRSRLYDIDILINRALVYGTLTGALGMVYAGGVAALEYGSRAITGGAGRSQLAIVASTLAIAALFQPLRRRIQGFIDRRFYRHKYDAARVVAAFGATLRHETNLEKLGTDLVGVVEETMQPASVTLWLRSPGEPGVRRERSIAANGD